jgi:hypothetical protein
VSLEDKAVAAAMARVQAVMDELLRCNRKLKDAAASSAITSYEVARKIFELEAELKAEKQKNCHLENDNFDLRQQLEPKPRSPK